jgi:hypothetical protein
MVQAVGPDTDGNIPGSNNGEGIGVLVNRTTGIWNTGTGFQALNHLTGGNQNTATGLRALNNDTNGGFNTGTGVLSLFSNTNGFFNTATGAYSLANNTTGNSNTANGYSALYYNTEGDANTATGFAALYHNIDGHNNTAIGSQALNSHTTGNGNTAIGNAALGFNTTGTHNTAVGADALVFNNAGFRNTALGVQAGIGISTATNVIAIGAPGENVSDSCYIGNIYGQPSNGGTPVYVNLAGKLGSNPSSRRFKDEIKPMDQASETILELKPVTFHYKKELDPQGIPQFGLVAEDVEKVNPDLVVRDKEGKVNTVRYEAVNAMLLNEFLKEHRKVQELKSSVAKQGATIAQQQKDLEAMSQVKSTVAGHEATIALQEEEIKTLTANLKEQAAQIQKVSDQLEVSKPAPQMVNNP